MVPGAGMALVVTLWLAVAATTGLTAAAPEPEVGADQVNEITAYLEQERRDLGIPGLAAVLVADGQTPVEISLGTADGEAAPVTPQTPFLLASLSKSVTAVAVAQLVEDGLVDLDDPVSKHLPRLAPHGDAVTVADLLHHRAGLSTQDGLEPLVTDEGGSLELLVPSLAEDLHPGDFEYSNAGYDVLARLVEVRSGSSYEGYLQDNVFGPLGMAHTTTDPQVAAAAGLATGHDRWLLLGYRPHEPSMPDGMVGSYRMFSTAHDLGLYLGAQLGTGPVPDSGPVIASTQREALHSGEPAGARSSYGGGLFVLPPDEGAADPVFGRTVLAHDGAAIGYRSMMWLWPDEGIAFAVLANANDQTDEGQLVRVAYNVQRLLLDAPLQERAPQPDPLLRFGKQGIAVLVLGQLLVGLAAVTVVGRRWVDPGRPVRARDRAALWGTFVLDALAVLLVLVVLPRALGVPLGVLLSAPDVRLMGYVALVLAVIGALTLLAAVAARRRGRGVAAAAST